MRNLFVDVLPPWSLQQTSKPAMPPNGAMSRSGLPKRRQTTSQRRSTQLLGITEHLRAMRDRLGPIPIVSELKNTDFAVRKRVAVYSFDASEGLLLDRLHPEWKQRYFTQSSRLIRL
jgi:hypothetical protein